MDVYVQTNAVVFQSMYLHYVLREFLDYWQCQNSIYQSCKDWTVTDWNLEQTFNGTI